MRKFIVFVLVFLAVIVFLSIVNATTATIGNSRVILRLDFDQSIEKYILVKNVNDFPVNIEMSSSGDLADYVLIKEPNFSLPSKEEKRAIFEIKAAKAGTTETKINVKFIPEKENAVGLSATIIVITNESDGNNDNNQNDNSNNQNNNTNNNNNQNTESNNTNNNNAQNNNTNNANSDDNQNDNSDDYDNDKGSRTIIASLLKNEKNITIDADGNKDADLNDDLSEGKIDDAGSEEINTIPVNLMLGSNTLLLVLLLFTVLYSKRKVKKKRLKESHA